MDGGSAGEVGEDPGPGVALLMKGEYSHEYGRGGLREVLCVVNIFNACLVQ